ncbi:hypothetical protein ABW21_db0209878 [Orbilia brochopaga]|nr:hypothetical protein ABW21_db0209878 [Drechslerella brochopaga]
MHWSADCSPIGELKMRKPRSEYSAVASAGVAEYGFVRRANEEATTSPHSQASSRPRKISPPHFQTAGFPASPNPTTPTNLHHRKYRSLYHSYLKSVKMSAIVDDEVIKVLITLHDGFDLLDFAGPLEVLSHTKQHQNDPDSDAFDVTIASLTDSLEVQSAQGAMIKAHISRKEALEQLKDFEVMIVPGGGTSKEVDLKRDEPAQVPIVRAFADLQEADPKRERTLMSVCTGSLFLAQAGVLRGLYATTHPDYDVQLEMICQYASAYTEEHRTEVLQNCRYVVNNARFDIGDPEEEASANPFIQTYEQYIQSRKERRKSNARRGSVSHRLSMSIPENVSARAGKRLGGLRVITAGGVMSGIDAALYVASAYVSVEAAEESARVMQHFDWHKGVVVDSIDF